MSTMDEAYKVEEHRLKKLYDTFLLTDLVRLNYDYSNKKYNNILGEDIWKSTIKKETYTQKEKDEIINQATSLLEIKYQLHLTGFEENIVNNMSK